MLLSNGAEPSKASLVPEYCQGKLMRNMRLSPFDYAKLALKNGALDVKQKEALKEIVGMLDNAIKSKSSVSKDQNEKEQKEDVLQELIISSAVQSTSSSMSHNS